MNLHSVGWSLICALFQGFAYLPGFAVCVCVCVCVCVIGATVVGGVGKFWILAFLEALKRNLMISKKEFCFTRKWRAWPLSPPCSPCTRTLFTYLQYCYFIYILVQI